MELRECHNVVEEQGPDTGRLTSSGCVGCDIVLFSPSSSESGSDSDGVLSSFLQTSQCVHCQVPINRGDI